MTKNGLFDCQCSTVQRRLDPGKETLERFFQVKNQKEYQNVVIISFVHLEKINIFGFMHKGVAQKLSFCSKALTPTIFP